MAEQVLDDQAIIYKVFRDAADGLIIDLSDKEVSFSEESLADFQAATDYVENLYEEGIGLDISDEQVWALRLIAIAKRAWFIRGGQPMADGRNFND